MKYYGIFASTDEKIIGKYTQTEGMGGVYDLRKPTSVWKIPTLKPIPFEPDLDYFNLEKKAKLTDVISTGLISAPGFIVNDKVKSIFDQFKLPKHKYYSAKVMHKGVKYDYFWFHIEEDIVTDNAVNFDNSKFELRDPVPFMGDPVGLDVHSTDELMKVWKENAGINVIVPLNLALKSNFENYDMLGLKTFSQRVVVNESLKTQLENDVTGFEFKPSFPISF